MSQEKQLKQQLHKNAYKNNRSNNCTRMSKETLEAALNKYVQGNNEAAAA
jgi:hypothetical protein